MIPTTSREALGVGEGQRSVRAGYWSSSGRFKPDPILSKLATGKLELEFKPDTPAATEKK